MATIEELEARAANIVATEAAALYVLAEAMRELAVGLPDGSQLAVDFARQARKLERFAGGPSPGLWGGSTMALFVRDRFDEWKAALDEA